MSYKVCATKRDVNTVGKPLQYFTPSQWIVKTTSYPSGYDISDNYELLQDGVLTNLKCTISLINGCVYEGMLVTINDNSLLGLLGTLHQKNYADQCTTKKYVLESNCSLTGQSASYDSNRLIREEDIIAPSTVNVYYDPRYLIVEEFKTDGISKFPVAAGDPGVPERIPGNELDPITHRDFAYSAILCTKGNKVQVRQKSTVNSDLVLNAVYAYDNLDAPIYELNTPGYEGAEFIASDNCFITFDLVALEYRLSAAAPIIDCATQWGLTIAAYLPPDEDIYYLASSGVDDPKLPICRPSEEEYILVPNEAEVNIILIVNTYETENTTTCVLRNLTTNETTTLTLNDDNECVFKMPSSDCRLETNVVIHETTGDTGFEYEDRILTIKSNQLERVIVNGSTYPFYDGVATVNIPCDESPSALAEVHFGAGIPAVYSIRAYATSQGPVSMPRQQSSPNTTLSLSTDMTLEISYNPVSCKYSALDGKISTLDKNLMWDDDTTITNVSYSRSGDYLLATSLSITSSPSDNLFFGKDKLTTVEFYTDRPAFEITKLAFTGCSSLHEVVLPNTNLTIGEQAFDNCRSLSKLELPSSLSTLGAQVFGENTYKAIYTNPSYIDTSGQTNALTFNVDDSYNSSLTELPKFTFEFCKNLEEVYLPASITKIKKRAFYDCNNIKHFAAPGLKIIELNVFENTWIEKDYNYNKLQVKSGGLAYKEGTSGIYFYFPHELTNPNRHVTLIKPDPGKNEYILYKRPVSFPGTGFNCYFNIPITSIADYGFACNDVVNFAHPYIVDFNAYSPSSSIKYIGNYAFKGSGAQFIDLNWHNVSYLGEGAFYNCKVLKMIPGFENAPITTIKPYTFYNCGGDIYGLGFNYESPLSIDFNLPNGTTEIGDFAFANCRQLMGIRNLAKCPIQKVGKYAFQNCFLNTHNIWVATAYVAAYVVRTVAELLVGHYAATGFTGGVGDTTHSVWSVAKTLGYLNYPGLAEQAVCEIVFGIAGEAAAIGDLVYNLINPKAYPSTLPGAILSVQKAAKTRIYLHFPKTTEIGVGAFKNCNYLGGCVFNSQMLQIPDEAFSGCERLDLLIFVPEGFSLEDPLIITGFTESPNISRIGYRSFYRCKKLIDFHLNDLLKNVTEIDSEAFKNAKILYLYEDQSSIIISNTVNCILDSALSFDGKIKLCFIAQDPFLKSYNSNMFKGSIKSNISLLVPEGSKQKYAELLDIPLKLIDECPLNDNWWVNLKEMKYQIPWISN